MININSRVVLGDWKFTKNVSNAENEWFGEEERRLGQLPEVSTSGPGPAL
jgi:hypothetical protein